MDRSYFILIGSSKRKKKEEKKIIIFFFFIGLSFFHLSAVSPFFINFNNNSLWWKSLRKIKKFTLELNLQKSQEKWLDSLKWETEGRGWVVNKWMEEAIKRGRKVVGPKSWGFPSITLIRQKEKNSFQTRRFIEAVFNHISLCVFLYSPNFFRCVCCSFPFFFFSVKSLFRGKTEEKQGERIFAKPGKKLLTAYIYQVKNNFFIIFFFAFRISTRFFWFASWNQLIFSFEIYIYIFSFIHYICIIIHIIIIDDQDYNDEVKTQTNIHTYDTENFPFLNRHVRIIYFNY